MRAHLEIDLNNLYHNARNVTAWIGPAAHLMAVVKADAYGHGLLPVAQTALAAGARWLGVATVAEGIALREAGLSASICLLCPFAPDEANAVLEFGLTPQVGDAQLLEALCLASSRQRSSTNFNPKFNSDFISKTKTQLQRSKQPEVHLDIDTGIGRSGIQPANAVALWRQAVAAGFHASGVSTHFADADNLDSSLNIIQENDFAALLSELQQAGARFDWIHTNNSPATLRRFTPAGNLVRPGLLLYGISPLPWHDKDENNAASIPADQPLSDLSGLPFSSNPSGLPDLSPVLTLKATVATVRALPCGHPISYGATVHLARPSRVATVLIGYGDGYPRRLSNNGEMLIRGQRVPILGRVCMDQTVVDVTDVPDVFAGDEAVCIGVQGNEHITVEEIAFRIETTPHEITTCLTARLPRIYLPA